MPLPILAGISLVSELAGNEKVREGVSSFTKKGISFIKDALRDVDDLPEITSQDFDLVFEYTENLFGLLGLLLQTDSQVCEKKVNAIQNIFEVLCFSETGYLQEPVLQFLDISKKDFEQHIGAIIQAPNTLKKMSRFAIKHHLEYEFYEYFVRVAYNEKSYVSSNDQELLDAMAESFSVNAFDVRTIVNKYKN